MRENTIFREHFLSDTFPRGGGKYSLTDTHPYRMNPDSSSAVPYHVPVLCRQATEQLVTRPEGIYIDATMGGAGHTRAILDRLSSAGHLFAFDRDADARSQVPDDPRLTFVASDFRFAAQWMQFYGVEQVDGILADLGVSSHHLDAGDRGFSYRYAQAVPDMRMNQRGGPSALDILLKESEEKLAEIFYYYGELKDSRRLASLIVAARPQGLHTVGDLLQAIEGLLPKGEAQRRGKLSRLFQALRIEVNGEMDALRQLLRHGSALLSPGGRLVFISYHSLEDRIIKDFFRTGATERNEKSSSAVPLQVITKKPLLPDAEEIARNPRARSAKLRIAERICAPQERE